MNARRRGAAELGTKMWTGWPKRWAPSAVMAASRATKAVGPAGLDQVRPALRVGPEARQKARQVAGKVGEQRLAQSILQACSVFAR
jgi:hypothetical protein